MAAYEAGSSRSDPHQPAGLDPSPLTRSGRRESRRARILVVDDDEGIRWLVRRILEGANYGVVLAGDGAAALRAADLAARDSRCAIHLVLTDLDMPGLDGFEVGRRLTARRSPIPVIYMSGTTYGLSHRSRLSQGEHFIEKPFSAHTLLREVSRSCVLSAQPLAGSISADPGD
jgi:CheY-like chemotaxis protein